MCQSRAWFSYFLLIRKAHICRKEHVLPCIKTYETKDTTFVICDRISHIDKKVEVSHLLKYDITTPLNYLNVRLYINNITLTFEKREDIHICLSPNHYGCINKVY